MRSHSNLAESLPEDDRLDTALDTLSDLPDAPDNLHSRVTVALRSADRWHLGVLPFLKRPAVAHGRLDEGVGHAH